MLAPFETEFTRAWDTPGHTRYQLPDTDVNNVLADRYTAGGPLTLTRSMLWDMEARKAAHPGTYIPYVVQDGSDRSWNRHRGDGGEYLDRCSMQRLWLLPQRSASSSPGDPSAADAASGHLHHTSLTTDLVRHQI